MTDAPATDCHTHVGLDAAFYLTGWLPYASSAQDLLGHMEAAGIERAVCFPFCTPTAFDPAAFARDRALEPLPGRFPYDRENDALLKEIDHLDAGDRLLPFAMFDPGRAVAEQAQRLRALAAAGHLAGLKTQTTQLRSPIRALLQEARALLEVAAEHNLPVVIHTAVHPDDAWAQVRDCLDVAAGWPQVRFNLAHSLRFDAEGLRRAAQLENVWVDCSAHLLHCHLARLGAPVVPPAGARVEADYDDPAAVLEAVHTIVGERYLWGSDSPYQSWVDDDFKGIFTYRQEADVLRRLPAEIADSMTRDAPRAWLGR